MVLCCYNESPTFKISDREYEDIAWRIDQWVKTLRVTMYLFFSSCVVYAMNQGFKEGNEDKQWFESTDTDDLVILKQGQ